MLIENKLKTLMSDGRLYRKSRIFDLLKEEPKEVNNALRSLRASREVRKVGSGYMLREFKRPDDISISRHIELLKRNAKTFTETTFSEITGISMTKARSALKELRAAGLIEEKNNKIKIIDDLPVMDSCERKVLDLFNRGFALNAHQVKIETGLTEHIVSTILGFLLQNNYIRKIGNKYRSTGRLIYSKSKSPNHKKEKIRRQNSCFIRFMRTPKTMNEVTAEFNLTRQAAAQKIHRLCVSGDLIKSYITRGYQRRVGYCAVPIKDREGVNILPARLPSEPPVKTT